MTVKKAFRFIVVWSVLLVFGCVAAIPVAIKYIEEKDTVVVNMTVDGKASDIYSAMVSSQTRKFPSTQVIKDDREDLTFEGKRVEADGNEIWGTWTAKQADGGKTEAEIRVKSEGMEEEALKDRVVNAVHAFCAEIGKTCQVE